MTKEEMMSQMRMLGAKIGKMELQRRNNEYIPIGEILKAKAEFYKLSRQYKLLYFKEERNI